MSDKINIHLQNTNSVPVQYTLAMLVQCMLHINTCKKTQAYLY